METNEVKSSFKPIVTESIKFLAQFIFLLGCAASIAGLGVILINAIFGTQYDLALLGIGIAMMFIAMCMMFGNIVLVSIWE